MFEFLRLQYILGRVTEEQLQKLVGVKITEAQLESIIHREEAIK